MCIFMGLYLSAHNVNIKISEELTNDKIGITKKYMIVDAYNSIGWLVGLVYGA